MICETWEGLTVDGKFPLLERLDGGSQRCVFLTVRQGINTAGIRLVVADRAVQDSYLARWEGAKTLSCPSLLQLMESGRSSVRGSELAYVVVEKTETVLSGIIPGRALAPAKVKETLDPIVTALAYLHDKGLIHGSVKPSNIALVGDLWKLATDEMAGAGELGKLTRDLDTYDAPEAGAGRLTPASDVWSLGIIAIEAFAQKTPMWNRSMKGDLGVPDWLPQPFREIAQGCLRWDPEERISIGKIQALLARHTSLSEMEPEQMTLAARVNAVRAAAARPTEPMPTPDEPKTHPAKEKVAAVPEFDEEAEFYDEDEFDEEEEEDDLIPRSRRLGTLEREHKGFGWLLLVGIIVLVAVAAVMAMRGYWSEFWQPSESQSAPPASQPSPAKQAPADQTAAAKVQPATPDQTGSQSAAQGASTQAQEITPDQTPAKNPPTTETQNAPVAPTPAPESQIAPSPTPSSLTEKQPSPEPPRNEEKPKEEAPAARPANARGAVVKRVLPSVAPGARQSMRRPLDVEVRVSVNARGTVSNTTYLTQGPGNYYARISHQAAEEWRFQSPVTNGEPQASEWLLRFHFDRSHVEVTATEVR